MVRSDGAVGDHQSRLGVTDRQSHPCEEPWQQFAIRVRKDAAPHLRARFRVDAKLCEIERPRVRESFFAGKAKEPAPLQIGRSWYRRWSTLGLGKCCAILTWPRVAIPHA